jgi:hypothetical protein
VGQGYWLVLRLFTKEGWLMKTQMLTQMIAGLSLSLLVIVPAQAYDMGVYPQRLTVTDMVDSGGSGINPFQAVGDALNKLFAPQSQSSLVPAVGPVNPSAYQARDLSSTPPRSKAVPVSRCPVPEHIDEPMAQVRQVVSCYRSHTAPATSMSYEETMNEVRRYLAEYRQ